MSKPGLPGRSGRRADRGFTLIEMMVGVVIMGLGMIALAAVFPLTVRIQRNTYDSMMAKEMAGEITSLLLQRGIKAGDLETDGISSTVKELAGYPAVAAEWPETDRSFPSTIADTAQRQYYWTMFFRRNDDDDGKLIICHMPPGNLRNPFTLKIAPGAWSGHEAHSAGLPLAEQDYLGPCGSDWESFKTYEMYVVIFRRDGDLPAAATFPALGTASAETFAYEPALQNDGAVVLPTADGVPAIGVWNGGPNGKILLILRFGNEVMR